MLKSLGKTDKYEVDEILICRLYKKTNNVKFNVNYRFKIVTFESRVDKVLNNVFLLLTCLCDFYDYANSKAIYDVFVSPMLKHLIQQSLITFLLIIMMNYIKTTICI